MTKADVRVRLTAEGVKEVQDALRTVQREAGKAAREGAGGINALRTSIVGLRGVLGSLGAAVVFRSVIRETIQAEQELAQLQAILRSTGEAAGFNQTQLVAMAEQFARATTHSTGEIIQAQTRLLSYSSIVGQNFPRALQIAIDQSVRLGQTTTQAAEIIGQAIETPSKGVVALTRQGFRFTEAQRAMFRSLEQSGRLAEAQAQVMDVLEESYGGAAAAARNTLGGALDAVGNAFQDLMTAEDGLPGAADELNKFADLLRDPGIKKAADSLFSGMISGASKLVGFLGQIVGGLQVMAGKGSDPVAQLGYEIDQLDKAIARAEPGWNNFWNVFAGDRVLEPLLKKRAQLIAEQTRLLNAPPPAADAPPPAPPPPPPAGTSPALASARREAERAAIAQELKLLEERNRQQEAADKRAHDQGVLALEDYFGRRIQRIREGLMAEEQAAARQIALVRAEPTTTPEEATKRQAQVDKIRADLALQRLQTEGQIADLAAEQFDAQLKAAEALPEIQQEILTLQGREADARRVALAFELKKRREMLEQAGLLTEAVEQDLQQLQTLKLGEIDISAISAEASSALDDLARQRQRIEQDVELGITGQLAGQRRILEIEKERLPQLQALAAAALEAAMASGNPEALAAAERLNLQIGQVAISVRQAGDAFARFGEQTQEAATNDLANWLASGITEAENLGDAFRGLAASIVDSIRRIAAEILARQAILALVGAFGGAAGGAAGGGAAVAAATGGLVTGPGTGTSDSIPALLSNREFVTRAAVVNQPGGLRVMHAINRGEWNPSEIVAAMTGRVRVPRFAEGGLVGAAMQSVQAEPATAKVEGGIEVRLAEGLAGDLINSPAGERALLKVLQKNRRATRQSLGI